MKDLLRKAFEAGEICYQCDGNEGTDFETWYIKQLHKPVVMESGCPVCDGKGWYFVDEWICGLQGRKDCKCKQTIL